MTNSAEGAGNVTGEGADVGSFGDVGGEGDLVKRTSFRPLPLRERIRRLGLAPWRGLVKVGEGSAGKLIDRHPLTKLR